MFTCAIVPLRIAFPTIFDASETAWNAVDIFIEWCFVGGVVVNFFTGFTRDGQLIMKPRLIWRNYLYGWFTIDFISSLPVDTTAQIWDGASSPLIRLNKVFRVA